MPQENGETFIAFLLCTEAAGDLRDVVFDVIHAAARLDRLLVFGTGGRLLPSKLAEPDSSGLLLVA